VLYCVSNQLITAATTVTISQKYLPSLLELTVNYAVQNNLPSPKILELEEIISECKKCKGCGKKTMLHSKIVKDAKRKVPVQVWRCWKCM
jgi:excinuclease UvrABC ATPase subunit